MTSNDTPDNIFQFPTKSVRDWAIIEREMKVQLDGRRCPEAVQDRLIRSMEAFYKTLEVDMNFSINAELPTSIGHDLATEIRASIGSDIGKQTSEILQAFTNKLWVDRLNREIDFCREMGLI